jgi:hypothetical protein
VFFLYEKLIDPMRYSFGIYHLSRPCSKSPFG